MANSTSQMVDPIPQSKIPRRCHSHQPSAISRFRLLRHGPATGAENMAIDEAITMAIAEGLVAADAAFLCVGAAVRVDGTQPEVRRGGRRPLRRARLRHRAAAHRRPGDPPHRRADLQHHRGARSPADGRAGARQLSAAERRVGGRAGAAGHRRRAGARAPIVRARMSRPRASRCHRRTRSSRATRKVAGQRPGPPRPLRCCSTARCRSQAT